MLHNSNSIKQVTKGTGSSYVTSGDSPAGDELHRARHRLRHCSCRRRCDVRGRRQQQLRREHRRRCCLAPSPRHPRHRGRRSDRQRPDDRQQLHAERRLHPLGHPAHHPRAGDAEDENGRPADSGRRRRCWSPIRSRASPSKSRCTASSGRWPSMSALAWGAHGDQAEPHRDLDGLS